MFDRLVSFVRDQYRTDEAIPLHAPVFNGRERELLLDTIDSTFVSSVGKYVDRFEADMAALTCSPRAVAVMNGTAGLHVALQLVGVAPGDLVVTQSLTFVATCNAIRYCGARPIFLDISNKNLSLCHENLEYFLKNHCEIRSDGFCWNKNTKKRVCIFNPE